MASIIHLCILHIHIFFYVASVITLNLDTDKQALIYMKSQTITQPADALATWDPSSFPCNWTRVSCDDRGQRVVGLDLSSLSISGPVSPYIGNLSFLSTLQLQENQFLGVIPEAITNLLRLRVLNISYNSVEGTIPSNLSRCIELRVVDLMQNELSGSIPEDLTRLVNLQTLNLAGNHLSGSIPPSIGNLSSLFTLRLGTNMLSAPIPSALSRLINLKHLDLTINNLSGTVPLSIYNMSSLENLAVASNSLSGDIPYNVGDTLPKLLNFNFCINKFTGTIPGSLHNLTNIIFIRMAHNRLHGTIPPGLGNLPELEMYNIGYNYINSSRGEGLGFLYPLVNSTKLDFLAIDGNGFDGVIPEFIGNFSKKLRMLYMGSNQISGSIPPSISRLQGLALLNLSFNSISGEIPSEIGQLEGLQELVLSKNRLTSNIPNSLGNLQKLAQIDLSSNELRGNIPISFGTFKRLTSMDLSMNKLNGNIPKEVLDLPGNIPSSIRNCKSLEQLILSNNSFSGNIPNGLGELNGLTSLDLSSNQLSGSIPLDLQNLKALQFLNLSFNNLVGNVPSNGIFSNLTRVHVLGNPKLCYDSKCGTHDPNKIIVISVATTISVLARCLVFSRECAALRHLKHRNLVKLITSCSSLDHKNKEFLALVYEYMKNGSLEKWIGNGMGLMDRLNVAINVACGLSYLHHECVVAPVVHCDLKPSNVLLDEDLTAKIGDFGLARMLVDHDQSISSTHVLKGSMGYIPPEYGMGGKPSTKGDVYSYGIMLMEIFTGKSPTDEMFVGGLSLKTWVRSAFPENLDQVLDPDMHHEPHEVCSDCHQSMSSKTQPDCLTALIGVALSCTNDSPEGRITITEALRNSSVFKMCFTSTIINHS
ncbi:hypothetical protein E3N88_43768 [Mikania micrantha]|uniref:non-specific serine/threonine protein kinase n=1 Tax=Mikania micrantha TaxID=192012 RepID=A0A5N6LE01_9ASTR|nr:hypothetical protein E3N88_43768 [Mikania micrantha]